LNNLTTSASQIDNLSAAKDESQKPVQPEDNN